MWEKMKGRKEKMIRIEIRKTDRNKGDKEDKRESDSQKV